MSSTFTTTLIPGLPAGGVLNGTDVSPWDQGGATVKMTANQVKAFVAGVLAQTVITASGPISVVSGGAQVMLVNVAGLVTINLPDLTNWTQGAIIVKDLGGNAAAFPITVAPFGTQRIDNLAQNFTIGQNRVSMQLYPLTDKSGWFVA